MATLTNLGQFERKAIRIPKTIDASGTNYKTGAGNARAFQSIGSRTNQSNTDLEALGISAMRWIATGQDTNINLLTSSIETNKQEWKTYSDLYE